MSAVIVAAMLVMGAASQGAAAEDAEEALARATMAKDAIEKLVQQVGLRPEQTAARQAWILREFPGTTAAARIAADRARAAFAAGRWDECIRTAKELAANCPQYGTQVSDAAYLVARIANDRKQSGAARRAALEALGPMSRHCSWILMTTRNTLAGLDMSPKEKYVLARASEEVCGRYPYARDYLWTFLEPYARAAEPAEAIAECRRFLERYAEDSVESIAARQLLLSMEQKRGDSAAGDQLRKIQDAQHELTWKARTLREACELAATTGNVDEALRQVEGARKLPGYITAGAWWTTLAKMVAAKASPEMQIQFYRVALECLPLCQSAEEIYVMLSESPLVARPEAAELAIRWLAGHTHDRLHDRHRATRLVRRLEQLGVPPGLRRRAMLAAAQTARTLEMPDLEADVLFDLGAQNWDADLLGSLEAMRRAAAACPGSLDAAKARWLAAFLSGEMRLVSGLLSRAPRGLAPGDLLPAVALPPAPQGQPDVVLADGRWQLRKLDPRENLVAGQTPTVSSGADTAALAADAKPQTFWKPAQLPATAVFPLRQTSTVSRVVLNTAEQAGVVVSLLDASGRALARYERSWNFWEQFRTSQHWAPETLTLEILPVAGVSYVRIDLLDALGTLGGIRSLEVYSPPVPAVATHVLPPADLPSSAKALTVRWTAEQPEKEVTHLGTLESVRAFPVARWSTPWKKLRTAFPIRTPGGSLGIEFFGRNATLLVEREGGARWTLDGTRRGTIRHPEKDRMECRLADDLPPGRHLLLLENQPLPAANDKFGADNLCFAGLRVQDRAAASVAVRFGTRGGGWADWLVLGDPAGATVPVPERIGADPPAVYQVGLVFNSRAVLAQETASVAELRVEAAAAGPAGAPPRVAALGPHDPSAMVEELAEMAKLAAERRVVVAYPKTGSAREYEAARQIAQRAGVYLVSDDIGLNLYPGLVLAVGRPLVHRYSRQLLGMKAAWNDPEYLGRAEGVNAIHRDFDGKPTYLFVTGETIEAVERAAQRLLQALPQHAPSAEPLRLFEADTLEIVYPWQLHPDRPRPRELAIRLGANDRRSAQLGICAERELDDLEITCSPLRSPEGKSLPAALVRPVGCYEWIPFFGDLRLPNLLLEQSRVSMPAATAMGAWLTVLTDVSTPPGTYTGKLTVAGGGTRHEVPVRVKVEPVLLPPAARLQTYSFAGVPYWFHTWTPAYVNALRELARNEAAHGVSIVQPRFLMEVVRRPWQDGSPITLDFGELDRQLSIFEEEYRRLGRPLPGFLCQSPVLHGINAEFFSEQGHFPVKAARLFARQFAAHLKATGRADRFYVKIADEPSDIAQWAEWAKPFHDEGLRTMTCHAAHYPNIETAAGIMNPWCPNYQHDVWRPFFRERQKAGEAFWWYCCGVPGTRLTGKPADNLPFYWLTAKWRFDGAMSYAAMHSSTFSMPVPFRYEHGMDHRIVFLADGKVLDTTRRELEGDGIRDTRLIEVIHGRAAAARGAGRAALADQVESALGETIERVVPYRYGYAVAPEAWNQARAALYDMAVRLGER